MTIRSHARILWLESKYEFLRVWRTPGYTVPALAFPLVFYAVFGILMGRAGHQGSLTGLPTYLVATYGACGIMGAAFQSFGVNVALERGQGWLEVKRASPMPPAAYVVGKTAVVLGFSAVVLGALALLASFGGGVRLPLSAWARLGIALEFGVLPFAALALLLATVCSPNAIGHVTNLAFMAGALASGLSIPIEAMPGWWQRAAVLLPPYHYGRLALSAIGIESPWPIAVHVATLAGFTMVSLALAVLLFARADRRA